jgi:hypothetical protein
MPSFHSQRFARNPALSKSVKADVTFDRDSVDHLELRRTSDAPGKAD